MKIYCIDCKKHTNYNSKLSAEMAGFKVCKKCARMNSVYSLFKPDDIDFYKGSFDIKWIKYDEFGRYKETCNDIEIDSSLLMSPFNLSYTWLTTIVTEIIENEKSFVIFKTENSVYKLFKPINENRSISK